MVILHRFWNRRRPTPAAARPIRYGLWFLCGLLIFSSAAHAHKLGEGYVFLKIYEDRIEGRVEVTLNDLNTAIGLDTNKDGKVSPAEFNTRFQELDNYLSQRLGFSSGSIHFPFKFTTHNLLDTAIGPYAVIAFQIDTPVPVPDIIRVRYELLFEADSTHRGLLIIEWNQKTQQAPDAKTAVGIFGPDHREHDVDLTVHIYKSVFFAFLWHGVWHIWIGIDHILFLIAFVLQAVVFLKDKKWHPVASFKPALWGTLKIVTLFTIAHSVTLSLAALGIVNLPSRLIESIIAASVLVAAMNAVVPVVGSHIGPLIFGFGLFHGFGFASVLAHLGLQQGSLAVPLVGFNLGVEIGQIGVICVTLPLCYALSRFKHYPETTLRCSASIIAFVALMWLIERAFELGPLLNV